MLSVTGPGPPSAELAGVLGSWRARLIEDWAVRAEARAQSGELDRDVLGAHLPALLDCIEDALLLPPGGLPQLERTSCMLRLVEEVRAPEALPELWELRGVLLRRWWLERSDVGGLPELLALDRAFDSLVSGLAHLNVSRHQRELARQTHVLETVIAAAPTGIAILDGSDLRTRMANPKMEELLGGVHLAGAPPEIVAGAVHDESWIPLLRQVAHDRVPVMNREYELRQPGGGGTWSFSAVALPSPERGPADVLVLVTDVSEQAAQRRRLEDERRRFEAVLAALPAGVIISDADGAIVYANQAARVVWGGMAPAARNIDEYVEYRGWWVHDGTRVQPGDWPLARAIRQGETAAGVLIDIERFDGTCGTMMNTAAPLHDSAGRLAGAVAVMLDMTEQRRLAIQLEQQTAELNTVLESIADGLVVFGPEGRVVRMNQSATILLPYDRDALSRAVAEHEPMERMTSVDGSSISPQRTSIRRALNGETVRGEMIRMHHADGSERWVSTSAAPIRAGSGGALGAVVILTDVTHLQEMRRRMEDLLRMLSHDLRTPLGTVLLQAQMLERRPTPESISRRAHAIATSAGRMNAMIQDLVDLARLETGRIKLNIKPIDVCPFVLDLKERLAGTFPTQRLRVLVPETLPAFRADPDRLERIMTNLISNALKYSPEDREVLIQAEDRDGGVALTVRDFGSGIPPEDLSRIFERYYRSHRAERGAVEGLGLGLYITRQLVEAHGATIKAESEPGQGSSFTILFPKA